MSWTITPDKFLSRAQIKTLLDFLSEKSGIAFARGGSFITIRNHYLIRTMLESGVRVAEFCALQHRDFHGHKLIVRNGKGGKSRTVLLTKATAIMLKDWIVIKESFGFSTDPTDPLFQSRYKRALTVRGVQALVKKVFRFLDFPSNLSAHSLRHSNATLLLEAKVNLARIRDNLGHHSISVTNLYAHALDSIEDINLYPSSTVDKTEKSTVETEKELKKHNDILKRLLRKTHSKRH